MVFQIRDTNHTHTHTSLAKILIFYAAKSFPIWNFNFSFSIGQIALGKSIFQQNQMGKNVLSFFFFCFLFHFTRHILLSIYAFLQFSFKEMWRLKFIQKLHRIYVWKIKFNLNWTENARDNDNDKKIVDGKICGIRKKIIIVIEHGNEIE